MSAIERLQDASAGCERHARDPWRDLLEPWLRGTDEISTTAALDLLGIANTSGNARQLARCMRSLNFIAIKSRRLMPGGRCGNTVTRGWARPADPSSRPRHVSATP